MTTKCAKARLVAAALLGMGCAAIAATRSSANYTLITESPDPGGAGFSASYANRSTIEPVTGYSAATIPDATTRFLWHGFVPQLDAPLFAVADVAVSLAANPVLCSPGEAVTYSGSVTNQSPEDAPGVVLTLSMPTNAAFVLATAGQGSAALTNNTVRFTMGTIPAGAVVPYSLQVTATSTGLALVTASATVEAVDSNFANNAAAAESLVVLTIYSVGSAIGGWFNPANWSPAIVPTTNHRAVVDGEVVDFYTADATVAGLVLTGGRIAGGYRLTVTKLAEWSGGELQSGLTLVIPPADCCGSPMAMRSTCAPARELRIAAPCAWSPPLSKAFSERGSPITGSLKWRGNVPSSGSRTRPSISGTRRAPFSGGVQVWAQTGWLQPFTTMVLWRTSPACSISAPRSSMGVGRW